jgi:hypothetical protein
MTGKIKSFKQPEGKPFHLLVIDVGEEKPKFFNVMPKAPVFATVKDIPVGSTVEFESGKNDRGYIDLTSIKATGAAPAQSSGGGNGYSEDPKRQTSIQRQAIVKAGPEYASTLLSAKIANKDTLVPELFQLMRQFDEWCSGGELKYVDTPEEEPEQDK